MTADPRPAFPRRRAVLAALLGALVVVVTFVAWPRGHGRAVLPGAVLPGMPGRAFAGPAGTHSYLGAVHIHVEGSYDSRVTLREVSTVARSLGLSFIVVTDHETPQPLGDVRARVDDGLLVIGGTEWSADDAHLVDLSPVPGHGPYPMVADALPDCQRRGGPCVASHPTAWRRPWRPALSGVDGVEIHGAMTALGDLVAAPFVSLAGTAVLTLLNPGLSLWRVGAFEEPAVVLWEAYAQVQPISAWCGSDVHGVLPVSENLRAFLTLVSLDEPLNANADRAAEQVRRALLDATCINALAGVVEGLTLDEKDGRMVTRARIRDPLGPAALVLVHAGVEVARAPMADGVDAELSQPRREGAWRAVVEVAAPGLWGRLVRSAAIRLRHVPPASAR